MNLNETVVIRPFFSIIIACYNSDSDKIKELLDSIKNQQIADEIEVIISDDCSTDISYKEVVYNYRNDLNIRMIESDSNRGISCTRERGARIATGEWICFADHDDIFVENSLNDIKNAIIDSGEKYYVCANFMQLDTNNGKIIDTFIESEYLLFAKFFNLFNLWEKYDIHFDTNMNLFEDQYILNQINYILINSLNIYGPLYVPSYCYIWNYYGLTLSDTNTAKYLELYIKSSGYLYLKELEKEDLSMLKIRYIKKMIIECIINCYYHIQEFTDKTLDNDIEKIEYVFESFLQEVKRNEILGFISNNIIFENIKTKYIEIYSKIKMQFCSLVEYTSIIDWLNRIDKD